MRKYILTALCTALCMSVSVPAFAADETAEYENMAELYNSWFRNEDYKYNYPDYVCGVWTETGDMSELVIAVTEDEKGEAGKEEILFLIEDDSTVKFVYQKYSYNELRDLQEEMSEYTFDLGIGVWGMGVSEMENCLTMDIENPESPEMQEFMEECKEKYGDMIAFEVGGAPTVEADEAVLDYEDVIITEAEETSPPETAISVAEEFSDAEEGGLVPTVIDDTIEPSFTLSEEYYTGALPEETTVSEWVSVPDTDYFGADEIVPATREDGTPVAKYMTMGDLYQAWYASGEYEYYYPDYVCGVWTETGDMSQLVVAVTKDEAGEAGKEEILSLIENDDSVKFTYQSYSYKELRQVQDEISPFMGDESGIYGLGVYEMDNKVHANIDMSNPNAEMYVEKLLGQYGDKLVFEAGNGITLDCTTEGIIDSAGGGIDGAVYTPGIGDYDAGGGILATGINADGGYQYVPVVTMEELGITTTITPAPASEPDNRLWIFAVCAAAVLVLGAVIAFAVNKSKAKQTSAGILSDGGRLTVSDTEAVVRKTGEEPSRDILDAVMAEIEK